MYKVMLFLHIVGTLALGFYLVLPFVLGTVSKLSLAAQEGTVSAVKSLNRYAQYGLVIQLLTGGYMISKGEYSVAWMIVVVVLFLAIAALGGIMGKPLRLALEGIRQKKSITAYAGKLTTLSTALSLGVLLIVFLMVYSSII
ncbi:hypothetical protein J2T12_000387 [Paenibacillus anaericanus]|uniref:DUF2269 family protein n=1 Tax=Paenibacillus anaericanus TaxID=170367 RepID=A0A433Y8D3_9BACL|nr:hypothetical protein [Paenibacillus anaericanus]MDQ0086993.1 hypothetical protein [Paenibacillus anaericanus]RUT46150.1 hypothetical protein EJP82_13590 [Paenibacillus anaericanus]